MLTPLWKTLATTTPAAIMPSKIAKEAFHLFIPKNQAAIVAV